MATTFKSNTIVQEAKDLSKYGKDFQTKVLALLIKDKPFALSILPILKDIYFTDIYLRTIFTGVKHYVTQYPGAVPTIDNVRIVLEDAGENTTVYNKLLGSIDAIGLEDRDFVIKNTRNFCFTKHALIEQEKITIALKEGNFELAQKLSIESFRHSGTNTARHYSITRDFEMIFEDERLRAPVATPFTTINTNTKGGPGAGDLGLIIAPSNFGKSAALQALTRDANFNGKNVIYFSYEMDGTAIMSRYIAGLVDIPQEELKFNRELITERMQAQGLGLCEIIKDKSCNATIPIIKNTVDQLKSTGFFPHLIIIDGLNQLKLQNGQWAKDDNAKYEILTEDLRDLCAELEIPGWAAWQTNREGFGNSLNDIKTIGKAIEVFQKADIVITFAQTPEQKQNGECIVYLLKNRHGKNEICLLYDYDPNKGLFIEKGVVNPVVLMDDKAKKVLGNTVNKMREKLQTGIFDKKN
jgi:hypothetical protein